MSQSELADYQDSGSIDHTDPETLRRLYHDEMHSLNEIVEMSDVGISTIIYHMDKHGIERRDKKAELKRLNRKERAKYTTHDNGRCYWRSHNADGSDDYVLVYRLLAVAEYGFEAVADKHVHHKNGIPWDNRPANIEPIDEESHGRMHGAES